MTTVTRGGEAVRVSPWGKHPVLASEQIRTALAAILDTHFLEWQERVDGLGDISGKGLARLLVMTATEYETVDGVSRPKPNTPDRVYLVADVKQGSAHYDAIFAHLATQCPGRQFSVGCAANSMSVFTTAEAR